MCAGVFHLGVHEEGLEMVASDALTTLQDRGEPSLLQARMDKQVRNNSHMYILLIRLLDDIF